MRSHGEAAKKSLPLHNEDIRLERTSRGQDSLFQTKRLLHYKAERQKVVPRGEEGSAAELDH